MRAGHAPGYFAVRSGATLTVVRCSSSATSPERTPSLEKRSAENTSSGAPPYSSAAATQYAMLNFAA